MDISLPILISYMVATTGYPAPDVDIAYVPKSFFVEHVCGGNEKKCKSVGGAYMDDVAPGLLFIDIQYEGNNSLLIRGMVLHELVHAGQYASGEFNTSDCSDSLRREREAYFVQDQYLVANGQLPPVRLTFGTCAKGRDGA